MESPVQSILLYEIEIVYEQKKHDLSHSPTYRSGKKSSPVTLPVVLSDVSYQSKHAEILYPITAAHQKPSVEEHHLAEKSEIQAHLI